MKIIILGGCGYIGSTLTKILLTAGNKVKIIDTQWFGKNLKNNKNLSIIKKDIRDPKKNYFGKTTTKVDEDIDFTY